MGRLIKKKPVNVFVDQVNPTVLKPSFIANFSHLLNSQDQKVFLHEVYNSDRELVIALAPFYVPNKITGKILVFTDKADRLKAVLGIPICYAALEISARCPKVGDIENDDDGEMNFVFVSPGQNYEQLVFPEDFDMVIIDDDDNVDIAKVSDYFSCVIYKISVCLFPHISPYASSEQIELS